MLTRDLGKKGTKRGTPMSGSSLAQLRSNTQFNVQALALSGILALAVILRFVGLGAESLWQDEVISVLDSRRPWLDIITERLTFHQPFYFLIMHFWAQAFGESEFALRAPSAIFGVATVLGTFILARHLLNAWVALGAALMTAVSPALVWYSQEARSYSLSAFLLVVSTYFLIRYLETRRSWLLIAYAGTSFLGCYTHYYFLPFVAAHNLVALVWLLRTEGRSDLIKWLAAQLIVALALIAKISTVLDDVSEASDTWTVYLSEFLLDFGQFLGFRNQGSVDFYIPWGLWFLYIIVWAIILTSSVVAIWRRDKVTLLVVICLLALIQLVIGGVFFDLPLVQRYLVPSIPLWSIITCYGFAWLAVQLPPPRPATTSVFVTIGVALLLGWTLTLWGQGLTTPAKQQWREAAWFVENNALPSDMLSVVPSRHFKHLDYYLENHGWEFLNEPMCQEHRRVWVVGQSLRVARLAKKLQQSCSGMITTKFIGIRVTVLLPLSSSR
jgi:mannosyltransferase